MLCVVVIEYMMSILHREEMPEGSAMHVRQKMNAANWNADARCSYRKAKRQLS